MRMIHGTICTVKSGNYAGVTGRLVQDPYDVGAHQMFAMDFPGVDWVTGFGPDNLRKATLKEELEWRREVMGDA